MYCFAIKIIKLKMCSCFTPSTVFSKIFCFVNVFKLGHNLYNAVHISLVLGHEINRWSMVCFSHLHRLHLLYPTYTVQH